MTSPADPAPGPRNVRSRPDLIRLFVRHPTAANLLMVVMIIAGLFALDRLHTQFFPDLGFDVIVVTVKWPGASASDVDDSVVQPLYRGMRFIDGVKSITANAFEARAVVIAEFEADTDMQTALSNVDAAVDQTTTLPEDSEKPIVRRIVRYDTLSRLLVSGPYPERSMKELAKRIRDDLLKRGIDKVDVGGSRDEEVHVKVRPEILRRLDLGIDDIARRIRQTSQDVPSGEIGGRTAHQIRSLGEAKTAREIGKIEIKSLANGQKILLRDIAAVDEGFDDDGKIYRHRGRPAIELHIQRAATGDALTAAAIVSSYLDELRPTLPPNIEIRQFDIQADLIRSRIELLLKNGLTGAALVLAVLFLFLRSRVALWVAVGIPLSLMATMFVMWVSGQSINMLSLFALIMAIGIVVDDAIVVGEHSETLERLGHDPVLSAEAGARRMAAPVFSSSLTTIAAFLPLLLITDVIGQIIRTIPLLIVTVIIASLIECFLVLPGHMRHALSTTRRLSEGPVNMRAPFRLVRYPARLMILFKRGFDGAFDRFRAGVFMAMVRTAIHWRYVTVSAALAVLLICAGTVAGGRVAFVFFPDPEIDILVADVELLSGTPRTKTSAMLDEVERAMRAAERKLTDGEGGLIEVAVQKIGRPVSDGVAPPIEGDHVGNMFVELVPSEKRTVTASQLARIWRAEIREMSDVRFITVAPRRSGPPGRDIDLRFFGAAPEELKKAAIRAAQLLASFPGVSGISDNLPYGKQEMILEVTPRGRALGFTTESVGRQVRNAFEGAIARRFVRGDEEVLVRVRHDDDFLDSSALQELRLRSPAGQDVPLSAVVTTRNKTGFARIQSENGTREVSITADLDVSVTTTNEVIGALLDNGLREIALENGVEFRFTGRAEEQSRTLKDMGVGVALGITLIYIILAWVFASYTRPIVVMSVIPLGFIGAIIGHLLLGFDLTILSLIALAGLSGIVVNSSIILVMTIKERLEGGEAPFDAIANGTCDRLRAVLLTSLTTIGGLTPILFETDLQAQFLIPMAITIVFGLMITSLLVLFVVPSLLAIREDFGRAFAGRRGHHGESGVPAE